MKTFGKAFIKGLLIVGLAAVLIAIFVSYQGNQQRAEDYEQCLQTHDSSEWHIYCGGER